MHFTEMKIQTSDEPILWNESYGEMDEDTIARRKNLVEQFLQLPHEAFSRLQFLTRETGCGNMCGFCSQGAATIGWRVEEESMRDVFAAMRVVASEVKQRLHGTTDGPLLGYDRKHKPGIIFAHFDNDPGTDPYLDEYIKTLGRDFGCQTRFSTVGYSFANAKLRKTHSRIANELTDLVAGVRFSLTPYTRGYTETGQNSGRFSREQFIIDFAEMLRTYQPLIYSNGTGADTAAVNLRFAPNLETNVPVEEQEVDNHQAIHSGPYLLITTSPVSTWETARVRTVANGRPEYTQPGTNGVLLISDKLIRNGNWLNVAKQYIDTRERSQESQNFKPIPLFGNDLVARRVNAYRFTNIDGPYYSVDPRALNSGEFHALHFYPKSESRNSGYLNEFRPFLNNLLRVKRQHGVERRVSWPDADWEHVDEVLQSLEKSADNWKGIDQVRSAYISEEVLPLVSTYSQALKMSGLPAGYFFDPGFSIDTGCIVNQGRALKYFRGLVSQPDTPLTPHQERGYGSQGDSSSQHRGRIWKISPLPFQSINQNLTKGLVGLKNIGLPSQHPQLVVAKLNAHNLYPYDSKTGEPLGISTIEGVKIQPVNYGNGIPILIGSKLV